MDFSILGSTLLSPAVLFFALGLAGALAQSQISVPEAIAKTMAIYLMMAIGLKGGVAMAKSGLTPDVLMVMASAAVLSFGLPLIAFPLLRAGTGLNRTDAAATAGHYGSISIVTFVAASQILTSLNVASGGYLVAAAALMEAPAIVTALALANRGGGEAAARTVGSEPGEVWREVFLNASILVLIGSLVIGVIVGPDGMDQVAGFFVEPFQGVLCLFLLDMGLAAGRGLRLGWRALGLRTIAFGVYMPLISAAIATAIVFATGMRAGDGALLITLAASASYIAVPAAMRLALPKARPSVYLTLSLGVTFPFNVTVGIPLYIQLAQWAGA